MTVRRYEDYEPEDRLDQGDGINHVHIDWSRVRTGVYEKNGEEGVIRIRDGEAGVFSIYRENTDHGPEIPPFCGDLT